MMDQLLPLLGVVVGFYAGRLAWSYIEDFRLRRKCRAEEAEYFGRLENGTLGLPRSWGTTRIGGTVLWQT